MSNKLQPWIEIVAHRLPNWALPLADKGEQFAVDMQVGPDECEAWLGMLKVLRPERPAGIKGIIASIENGEFAKKLQVIAISKDGVLVDGQNRLWAVWMKQAEVDLRVCFNVSYYP